jgi:hypothetical protein
LGKDYLAVIGFTDKGRVRPEVFNATEKGLGVEVSSVAGKWGRLEKGGLCCCLQRKLSSPLAFKFSLS